MSTKQFMTLDNLTTYDGLIKQYIGTEDAKSIKSLTVSGNTVSFYKTADASGTAAYTVNMPDVSNFMEKISGAVGDKLAVSNSDGSVRECEKADLHNLSIVTGYSAEGLSEGYLTQGCGGFTVDNAGISVSDAAASVAATAGFNGDNTIASALADKIDVIANATGGKITVSDANGGVAESALTVADVTGKIDKIASATGGKLVTSTSAGQVAESNTAIADLATQSDLDDLMPLGDGWSGDLVAMTNSDGTISEGMHVGANAGSTAIITGYMNLSTDSGYIILKGDGDNYGDIVDSNVKIEDLATQTELADKIDKIANATGGKIATTTATGEVAESSTAIADLATQSDIASFLTGYNYTNSQDKILISHGDPSEGDIEVSTVDIDDIATQTDLSGKMSKGPWNDSTGRIVLTAENGEVYYGSIFGQSDSTQIFALTGYGYTPVPGNILIFDNPTNGGLVDDSGVALSDLATKAFVGSIPQGATATTVVGYVDEAVAEAGDDAEITLVEAQTPTTGYLKTYELYQGGNAAANLVGKIDIPKDLVVTSGEIVVNPTGQPAGTYLKLTIANQTTPVYINVADLADVYTAASGATQVQLAISATNEISATLVAGGVGATELASNAVTTAKIADDAVTADKVSIAAHSEIQTAAAANGNVAITVTTTDGQVSAVSASIPANTYDAYGAASGVQTALVGTSSDPASADTINGAKAYADAATASIPTSSIEALFA